MSREIISPKLDVIFKKIFTENRDLLQAFVCDLMEIKESDVQEITLLNNELPPDASDGKLSRLDLNLKINDILVNVEIQVRTQSDFRDRTLYYWSKLYCSELKQGETYRQLKKTVAINIVDFNIFDALTVKDWHSEVITVRKGTQDIFSDKFHIHFYELRKLAKAKDAEAIKSKSRQELWMQFLNARNEEDLSMLENTTNEPITKAVKVVFDLSEDTKLREWARMREKAIMDEQSALSNAREEGRLEGREEGRAEGREEGRLEGREEGRLEGRAEGRAEGRLEGREQIIQAMRNAGIDENTINTILNSSRNPLTN